MSKKRLYELAKELGLSSKELLNKTKILNINVNTHMSTINSEEEKIIKESLLKKEDSVDESKKITSQISSSKQSLKKDENIKITKKQKALIDEDYENLSVKDKEKPKKILTGKKVDKRAKKNKAQSQKKFVNQEVKKEEKIEPKKPIRIGEIISVKDLSEKIGKPVVEIIKKLLLLGVVATINQDLEFDTACLIALEYGITLEKIIQR